MRRSKIITIKTNIFNQLSETVQTIEPLSYFQNISQTKDGYTKFRVVVVNDDKFEMVTELISLSKEFVPLYFGDYEGNKKPLSLVKEVEVKFLEPVKMYSYYGISTIYRMISNSGDLLFTITDKVIDLETPDKIISGRIKKTFPYLNGNSVTNVNYLRVNKDVKI